jgi:hypothetical protein
MLEFLALARARWRFKDYRPEKVTFKGARRWLAQFDKLDRPTIASLLDRIVYFSERETKKILIDQNDALLRKLKDSGLRLRNIIYVQLHDAGSSSPVMVNMLKDGARLEPLGCKFRDSRDALGLNHLTNTLTEGAIVYVDDFLGTGTQFYESRDFVMENIVGNFAEFLLAPCVCEEAYARLARDGVEIFTAHVHTRAERPLHENSAILGAVEKERLRGLCAQIERTNALGFEGLAAMVAFYRNAPDTLPRIFRGNVDQDRYVGILPRISDLPKRIL